MISSGWYTNHHERHLKTSGKTNNLVAIMALHDTSLMMTMLDELST
jgi:hypothetical protein